MGIRCRRPARLRAARLLCPRPSGATLALAGRRRRARARVGDDARALRGGGGAPAHTLRSSGLARADAALHVEKRARRAMGGGRPGDRGDRRRIRLRGRIPCRGRRLAARRRMVRGRARAGGGRPRPERPRGPLGRGSLRRRPRRGGGARGDRRRGAFRRRPSAREGDRRGGARAGGRARPACRRLDANRRAARARGRPVRDRPRRPDCRRGLPVVRRVVARPDDVVRGPVPLHRTRRRGARGAPARRRDAVGGDAREHRRHRRAGVQHLGRDALVRPRARTPSRGHRRRRPRRGARAGARRDRDPPPGGHAVRDRRRRGRSPAAGSRGLGADVDGRAHRRRARHASHRQAGRGERPLDPGARDRRPGMPHGSMGHGARDGACVVRPALRPRRRRRAARRRRRPRGRRRRGASEPAARGVAPGRPAVRVRSGRLGCRGRGTRRRRRM